MRTSESIAKIGPAFCKCQAAIKPAEKDAVNPLFSTPNKTSGYATLAALVAAIRPHTGPNGLYWVQEPTTTEAGASVQTSIFHESGEWFVFDPLVIPTDKKNAHGMSSAVTYAKKISLAAAFGIVAEDHDDDGNGAAMARPEPAVKGRKKPEQLPPDETPNKYTTTRKAIAAAKDDPKKLTRYREAIEKQAGEYTPAAYGTLILYCDACLASEVAVLDDLSAKLQDHPGAYCDCESLIGFVAGKKRNLIESDREAAFGGGEVEPTWEQRIDKTESNDEVDAILVEARGPLFGPKGPKYQALLKHAMEHVKSLAGTTEPVGSGR